MIDWEDVLAVPLKLSAISIGESMIGERPTIRLDSKQDRLFQEELYNIEQERRSSNELSQMFLHSVENKLLFEILRPREGSDFVLLRKKYPQLFAEALRRSSQALAFAASEWNAFADETFRNQGLPVPDWPQYVEIQEGLGLYGRSSMERLLRKFKRLIQRRLDLLWDGIHQFWNVQGA